MVKRNLLHSHGWGLAIAAIRLSVLDTLLSRLPNYKAAHGSHSAQACLEEMLSLPDHCTVCGAGDICRAGVSMSKGWCTPTAS